MYKRDTFHPANVLLSQQDPREEKQEPAREPEETREPEGRGRAVGGAAGKPPAGEPGLSSVAGSLP